MSVNVSNAYKYFGGEEGGGGELQPEDFHELKMNGGNVTRTYDVFHGLEVTFGSQFLTKNGNLLGEYNPLVGNGTIDLPTDASDDTSTFTKASGDTSTMVSGGKLSAIFGAISSFFASLKALAFKDKASYDDLSSGVQSSLDKADSALQSHQSVTDNNPTLAWGATSTVGTVGSTNLQVTMPSNPASGKADKASITGATKCKITYNGQGIVTAGDNLSASDIPSLAASKITSGQFGTDRIADDAITAAKVKDNETLPVNISGVASTVALRMVSGTYIDISWANVSWSDFCGTGADSLIQKVFGSNYTNANRTITFVGRVTSCPTDFETNTGIPATAANNGTLIGVKSRDAIFVKFFTNAKYGGQFPVYEITFGLSPNTGVRSITKNVVISSTGVSLPGGVGSASTPVYVDANGQVQPCTPSSMSVGSVSYADSANGTTYKITGVESDSTGAAQPKKLETAKFYKDDGNGSILILGNTTGIAGTADRGILRLAAGNGHYSNLRFSNNLSDDNDTTIAGPTLAGGRVIPVVASGGAGSPSTPVYVDDKGQVKPCDSIDLGTPKHSATITSGAGVVYYTSPADTFAIAINYDRANSKAYITVNNAGSGRQLYVSLGHSNNLTPVAHADNAVIVGTTSEYNLFDLDILCMGIGDEMPVFSFTIGIQVNESKCTYTIYDRMKYHL